MRLLSRITSRLAAAVLRLREGSDPLEGQKWVPISLVSGMSIRPGQGRVTVLSMRRQLRRAAEKVYPNLKSGRQWRKYRKAVQRETGVRFCDLPSYVTKA